MTYIQTFIMADSEDEFMPIFVDASAAFVAMTQRKPRRKKHSKNSFSEVYLGPGRAFRTILDLCFCVFASKNCFLCECYPTHHSVDSLNIKKLLCRRLE